MGKMRLLLGILLVTLFSLSPVFSQAGTGHVKGEVWYRPFVDRDNSFDNVAVPNCEVVFSSTSNPKKVVASGDGHFEVDLPAGVYSATASCMTTTNSWEYHPAVRPDFEVKTGTSALLNLLTLVKRSKANKTQGGEEQPEYKSDDLKSEFLELKTASGPSRKILVRFLRRAASKELAEYQGRRDYRQDAPASVTFDALAIYSDSITIEKPAMNVKAVGHVVVEDGKQRRQGNEATVDFSDPNPLSTLKILGQPR
jgi:hypothetical protein